tara:strand:- start:495 stop:704 length:210 start_codon:yes stop_codon:yes gene_type:complete
MPQRILRFRISQDGSVQESVEGFTGKSCLKLTEKLESALGNVQQRELTSEAYICPEEQSHLVQENIKTI